MNNSIIDNTFKELIDNLKEFTNICNKATRKLQQAFDITGEDTRLYTSYTKLESKAYEFVKIYVKNKWSEKALDYLDLFVYEHNFGEKPLTITIEDDFKYKYEISDSLSLQVFFDNHCREN